jgi:peroxiredoxin (alkyl hydroperoxide reductase subunit C)
MKNLSTRKADYSKFQDLNIQILAISSGNPFSQKALADSLKLPYPLLSDFPDLKVIKAYDRLSPSQMYAERAFFLVDKQGIIRGRWPARGDEVFSSKPILKVAQEIAGKPK